MKGYYIRIMKMPSMEIRLQTKRYKSMRVAEEIYQEMKLDTKPGEMIAITIGRKKGTDNRLHNPIVELFIKKRRKCCSYAKGK
jgi:hypothetical protein